ncbi:serine/threonine-protein kinase [Nannocystis sp. SCPEA4]|uniref:serine/threonine-protein kinase n=1 Tax=Nannocystis sp. SCPEA4 TaxID=2996787 RepID=UPI002270B835|nr:serine/threonine-protein kinase [Nannocystis sp. SCPEA4]MCY1060596.1 serine/threonine-protein kinase [Nannocystis sp. SCPEA4]
MVDPWTSHNSPAEPPPENFTGRTLAARFRLDERIVYTKTSSLYRGRDLHGRAAVAVKILRPELDGGREERFRREGQILANIRHANIADFIDCGRTEDGLCYLVTAFVDGLSLAEYIDAEPLPLAEVWQVGLQLADALDCAHERGVIHRDIKPSNVMRTASGVVKLIDFGIARVEANAELEVTPVRHPTVIGVAVGTPGFVPPEAGVQIDARTDVFGLGRTLYRLLTRNAAKDAPAGLEKVPEPLRRVVLQAMLDEPAARIASAKEFRSRWREAGAQVWPLADVLPLRPAPHVWPPPSSQAPAPDLVENCSRAGAGEPCTTTVPPRLFERRLELRTLLGKGRRGQTWRAYHHTLGRDVAVKIVPRALPDGEVAAALCREAMALDKLRHRAFPRVLECDYAEDGSWYMVEEYIDGEPLGETFKRAPVDPLVAVELVCEIAEALGEAHARGIVHGDIHGGNILLERGLPPRPRIIDLSECRLAAAFFAATDQRYASIPLHRPDGGAIHGHPSFCAPELGRGAHPSEAADVYALGVVLFVLLTGEQRGNGALREIFGEGEREAAGERLRERVIASAPELADTFIAADLQDILAPEPERRTATMAGLLEMLRVEADALRELRIPAAEIRPPVGHVERTAAPSRALRFAAAGALVVAALAAAAALWPAPALDPTTVTEDDVEQRPDAAATPPAGAAMIPVNTAASPRRAATPATRAEVHAAVAAHLAELRRCPGAPGRLTLAIDVGREVALAEIQHVSVDPTEPLDRCVRSIVDGIRLPTSATSIRHTISLELSDSEL